jgi:hypothetical protein
MTRLSWQDYDRTAIVWQPRQEKHVRQSQQDSYDRKIMTGQAQQDSHERKAMTGQP